jgi:hypothetical protein
VPSAYLLMHISKRIGWIRLDRGNDRGFDVPVYTAIFANDAPRPQLPTRPLKEPHLDIYIATQLVTTNEQQLAGGHQVPLSVPELIQICQTPTGKVPGLFLPCKHSFARHHHPNISTIIDVLDGVEQEPVACNSYASAHAARGTCGG